MPIWFPFIVPSVAELIYLLSYFLILKASSLARKVTVNWSSRVKTYHKPLTCKYYGPPAFTLSPWKDHSEHLWTQPPSAIINVKTVYRKLSIWCFLSLKLQSGELFTRAPVFPQGLLLRGADFGKRAEHCIGACTTPMLRFSLRSPVHDEAGRSHPETIRPGDGVTLWKLELPSKEEPCPS